MSNDSLVERQEDELKALQAIFEPDDVTDLRSKDVWQVQLVTTIIGARVYFNI